MFVTPTKNGCLVFGRGPSESNLPRSVPTLVSVRVAVSWAALTRAMPRSPTRASRYTVIGQPPESRVCVERAGRPVQLAGQGLGGLCRLGIQGSGQRPHVFFHEPPD